MFAVHLSPYC